MRYIISIYILLQTAVSAFSTELTDSADRAYENTDYEAAVALYSRAIDSEGISSNLYYNLGNAQYRLGNTAQAILAYERALRLDPGNAEARANLEFVNQRITDKKGETGSFLYNTYIAIASLMSSNRWAISALLLLIVTVTGAIVYASATAVIIRKIGFFGSISTALLFVGAIVLSISSKAIATDDSQAIITAESTTLSTAPHTPMNHQEEAMLLHEGTKVRILRTIGLEADSSSQTWHEVQVDNKHRAWINGGAIEPII